MRRKLLAISVVLSGILFAHPAAAHNGTHALAVPIQGITVDGDLQDWPAGMRTYPLTYTQWGAPPQDEGDFSGSFRIGYNPQENALYLAMQTTDESAVIDTVLNSWNTQDGCEVSLSLMHDSDGGPTEYHLLRGHTFYDGPPKDSALGKVQFSVGQHSFEWRFDLKQQPLQAGMVLGLAVTIGDKDEDGSFSRISWGPSGLGDLILADDIAAIGRLEGRATWEIGQPAAEIPVQLHTQQTGFTLLRTDRAGHYGVDLPAATYQVKSPIGRQAAPSHQVQITPGATLRQNLSLPQPQGQVQPAGQGRGHWQTFGVADGLASHIAYDILQDRQGNIWFATETGASRYNGAKFTTFTTRDGLTGNWVWTLLEDRQGNIWFGTGKGDDTGAGLSRYDGTKITAFTEKDGLPPTSVWSMLEDQQGHLWLGMNGGRLSRYNGKTFTTFTEKDGLPSNFRIQSMLEDRQGHLWLATEGQATGRYDGSTYTPLEGLFYIRLCKMLEDRAGHLWFATDKGVSRYDGKTLTAFDRLNGNEVLSILQDKQGNMWFGTKEGVSRYNGTANTKHETAGQDLVTFTAADGLAHNSVGTILEDREGHLWFGSSIGAVGGGISRYSGDEFVTFTAADGLAHNNVHAILEDRNGHLWFGTDGGVSRYDGDTFTTFTSADGLAGNLVDAIAADERGNLWFSTDKGAGWYDGKHFVSYPEMAGIGWSSMVVDRRGHLWLGVFSRGLKRYDGAQITHFPFKAGWGKIWGRVTSLLVDRQGRLWVGTWSGGVSRFDGEEFQLVFTRKDGLGDDDIAALLEDRQGNLWIGTHAGGLSRYKGTANAKNSIPGEDFVTFTVEDGLAGNWVTALMEDRQGHLWIGTKGGGVSRFDGRVFQTLLKRDGLADNNISHILEDRRGDVWIGTLAGLTRYRRRPTPPPIHINQVIADRDYGAADSVQVPSTQAYLAFGFAGQSLKTRPGQLTYAYRLQGYDADWQTTRQEQAAYRDLPVGKYRFEVKAVDRDLTYSAQPAQVHVEIYPRTFASPLRLEKLHLGDVFASFYSTYSQHALGSVQLYNDEVTPLEVTLRFGLPKIIQDPIEQSLVLAPQSSQIVDLYVQPGPQLLQVDQTQQVTATVALTFDRGGQKLSIEQTRDITLYGRGKLQWDQVSRAAAFITSDDPNIAAFTRPLLGAFENEIQAMGLPLRNIVRAMVLFEALKGHGVRYTVDANTPYARMAADKAAVDHIQYPVEVLQNKAGDCDDLSALYCSLLENTGVATALVDYPQHIFLLFDSGVEGHDSYKLPLDENLYVERGEHLWIPLEITQLDQSFLEAWKTGARQLAELSPLEWRRRTVDTAVAWRQFPAVSPQEKAEIAAPDPGALHPAVSGQYNNLKGHIDAYIDDQYIDPLKQRGASEALRLRLLKIYLALRQYDKAINTAVNDLLDEQGDKASTYNQLGIANFLKGDVAQAAFYFKQAVDLHPDNQGIQRNLDRALQALGRTKSAGQSEVADQGQSDELKGAELVLNEESFYWLE